MPLQILLRRGLIFYVSSTLQFWCTMVEEEGGRYLLLLFGHVDGSMIEIPHMDQMSISVQKTRIGL